MVYQPGIPQPGDPFDQSVDDIRNNFGALQTNYSLDHFAWNASTSAGLHKWLQLQSLASANPLSGATTPLAPTAPNAVLYTFGNPAGLYYQNNSTTSTPLVSTVTTYSGTQNFMQIGNLKFQWGLLTIVGQTTNLDFTPAFSNTTYSLTVTPNSTGTSGFFSASITSNSRAVIFRGSSSITSVFYIAIGV